MKLNKKRKGFTLVELIVVIVILGILMLIGSMKYADVKDKANISVAKTNHRTLVSAMQLQMATAQGAIPQSMDVETIAPSIVGAPKGVAYSYDVTVDADVGGGGVITTKFPDDGSKLTIKTSLESGKTKDSTVTP